MASGDPLPADERWLDAADLVVAVDGGAGWLASIGRRPDVLVGDLDSVDPGLVERLEGEGVEVERHPAEKESSDTELAMAHAVRRGADRVVVLGAVGGARLDHELANVLLLAAPPSPARIDLRIVRGATCLRMLRSDGSLTLEGPAGAIVSLLPLGGDADGVTTNGLRYALHDEPLHMGSTRGLSNVVATLPASVQLRHGMVLVIETQAEE